MAGAEHTYRVRRDVDRYVSFRLTDDMKENVKKEAERMGMSRSEFIRTAIDVWLRIIAGWR